MTTWRQQLVPASERFNFGPGSGSSFLSSFCFVKRHTEVSAARSLHPFKSLFLMIIRQFKVFRLSLQLVSCFVDVKLSFSVRLNVSFQTFVSLPVYQSWSAATCRHFSSKRPQQDRENKVPFNFTNLLKFGQMCSKLFYRLKQSSRLYLFK